MNFLFCLLQEQANDAKLQAASPVETEDLSPLPAANQPVKRRGGISAEPVSEEDATSYVKKVRTLPNNGLFHWLELWSLRTRFSIKSTHHLPQFAGINV